MEANMRYNDMKFEADSLFKDFDYLFCPDFKEGFQAFRSWNEFLHIFSEYYSETGIKPLYVFSATLADDIDEKELFVDVSQIIVIPWDELENYI